MSDSLVEVGHDLHGELRLDATATNQVIERIRKSDTETEVVLSVISTISRKRTFLRCAAIELVVLCIRHLKITGQMKATSLRSQIEEAEMIVSEVKRYISLGRS